MEKRENEKCFSLFCENFLARVVGITRWRDSCTKCTVSEMATASDEAFAYLLVENYWSTWSAVDLDKYQRESTFENGSVKKKKRTATFGKYTQNAYGAKRFGGWTRDGLIRFNELHGEVKADREKNGSIVEENFKKHCLSTSATHKKVQKFYGRDIIAICEDITDLI